MTCPVCDNKDASLITRSFLPKTHHCQACQGHFITDSKRFDYPEEYFLDKGKPTTLSRLSSPFLDFFYTVRVEKIKKLLKQKKSPKVLDYGCGSGKLVERLIADGIFAYGFEPSKAARKIAKAKKLPVFNKIKPLADGWDLIMFWHSLEHTDNPLKVIKGIKKYLKKDGKLLIAVPNAASFEAKIAKDKWFHYTYPLHRVHFTPKSIETMFAKAGFKMDKIDFFNPEYTISGLVQSFLNLIFAKDVLYGVISHRRLALSKSRAQFIAILSVFLTFIFSPFLLIFFTIQLLFKKTGAIVIVTC